MAPPPAAEPEKDARSLFIRNIAYGVDEAALEEVFADVGPVRQAFLVRAKGEQKHRGFGFVQYAIQEDAQRAQAELDGRELQGRRLKVRCRECFFRSAPPYLFLSLASGLLPGQSVRARVC
jgi:nucleolar protein 4